MPKPVAVLDANVLYPAPLRDLLVSLAVEGAFAARWTEAIHAEWIENLLEHQPRHERARLERTRDLMNRAVRDCLVMGYEPLIPTLRLRDADDRHVLAAAIRAGAEFIVTFNLRDFPAAALAPYNVEARHPDDFVLELLDQDAMLACRAVRVQRARLKNPPHSVAEMLQVLEAQGLAQSVARLRRYGDFL